MCVCVWDIGFNPSAWVQKKIQPIKFILSKYDLFFKIIWSWPPDYHESVGVCKTAEQGL